MGLDNENLADLPKEFRTDTVTNFVSILKPTAKAAGDTWYKPSDGSDWYWNGTYWLSKETFALASDYRETQISTDINLWGTAFSGRDLSSGRSGIYFLNAANTCYQASASSSADYWNISFYALYSDGSFEGLISHTTANKPANQWFEVRSAINSAKNSLGKTTILVYASIAKIGTPNYLYAMTSLQLKWIHP